VRGLSTPTTSVGRTVPNFLDSAMPMPSTGQDHHPSRRPSPSRPHDESHPGRVTPSVYGFRRRTKAIRGDRHSCQDRFAVA